MILNAPIESEKALTDVLRDLPIANDWDEVAEAAESSATIRDRVGRHISSIWEAKSKKEKENLRQQAMTSQEAFRVLLDAIRSVLPEAYDIDRDPQGVLSWARTALTYTERYPLKVESPPNTIEGLYSVVAVIIDQYRQLIEHNGLNRELYDNDGKPKHESSSQRLFFAVALSYCQANNLDISPEVDSGSGQIDFKFSHGYNVKVLVEIKLSTNNKVVRGYEKQLEVYKATEQTNKAV